ncbi:hypothetical protein N7478_006277 [Penicillium angulare]|uniref:uncharacterized protein n=1 Tax=Penicillium angulare TaxID=116970 RepID=UPI0025407718|nr:uncharacterized protein N7478_006277 [Penicillium angulare]KAJ5280905.1 hypothetical protein N7478_006277 [Penicillium angulare]
MTAQYAQQVRETTPPQAARTPLPRYYAGRKNLQRIRDSTVPSTSLENPHSSESVYSDEKSIFNAIRVTTPNEESHGHDYPYDMGHIMERGLAANIAMLIPPESSQDGGSTAQHRQNQNSRPRLDKTAWRSQLLSEQDAHHKLQLGSAPLDKMHNQSSMSKSHRKAISLDACATHRPYPSPRWLVSSIPAAVTSVQPKYPPPERVLTPPGLPSFNTPEAMYCSAQFMVGHTAASQNQRGTNTSNGYRSISYGGAIRRFLGLPSTNDSSANNGIVGIGRAPDGTIVQGRFLYRQSGHGTNQTRNMHDHPFHRSNLPTASSQPAPESIRNESERAREGEEPAKSTIARSSHRKRNNTHLGLSLLGRPLTARIDELYHRAIAGPSQRTYAQPVPDCMISPLQLPQAQYSFSQTQPDSQVQVGDGALESCGFRFSDLFGWLPIRIYLCCCAKGPSPCFIDENNEDDDSEGPLEAIVSRETYATARTRISGLDGGNALIGDGNCIVQEHVVGSASVSS